MSKNEWELNIFPGITFNSLNNGINEQINILIESLDKFSFGEDETIENKQLLKKIEPENFNKNYNFKLINKNVEELNNEINLIKSINEINLFKNEFNEKKK